MSPRFVSTLWALFLPFSCHVGTEKWGNQSAWGPPGALLCAQIRGWRRRNGGAEGERADPPEEEWCKFKNIGPKNGNLHGKFSTNRLALLIPPICAFFSFLFARPKPIGLEICLGNAGGGRSAGRSCRGFPRSSPPSTAQFIGENKYIKTHAQR